MGIQGFFNFFKKQSDDVNNTNKFIVKAEIDSTITRIYVDFISVIYDLVIDFPDLLNNRNDEVQELLLIQVNRRLETIVNYYPEAEIYVFFEAIPTVAKMVEQYARRMYRKILSDVKQDIKTRLLLDFQEFDYGLISFNSPFMIRLYDSLRQYFGDLGRTIYIDTFDPAINNVGEAEHRIISHIASNLSSENNNYIIYSPDADVFILSTLLTNNLSSEIQIVNVNTMRRSEPILNLQTNSSTRDYFFISSNNFMNYLVSKITETTKNRKRLIADILFVFNILGDDFLPIFKNFSIYDIDILYRGYINLPPDIFILDYNELDNKFSINKDNLRRFFSEILPIDSLVNKTRYYSPRNLEKSNFYFETNFYNRIVYDYLINTLDSGNAYLNEKSIDYPYNRNNFGFNSVPITVPPSYDINYLDPRVYNGSWYFLDIQNKTDTDTKTIGLNKLNYFHVNLTSLPNQSTPTPITNPEPTTDQQIINYLEGYQFILDLYFNNFGVVLNNFWYYKYAVTPTIAQIIAYLDIHDLPNYVVANNPKYFTAVEYQNYLNRLVDINYQIALNSIKKLTGRNLIRVGYDDLIKLGRNREEPTLNIIFDCEGKKYINKCVIDDEVIESPIEFIIRIRARGRTITNSIQPTLLLQCPESVDSAESTSILNPSAQAFQPKKFVQSGKGVKLEQKEQKEQEENKKKYLKYKAKYLDLKKRLNL